MNIIENVNEMKGKIFYMFAMNIVEAEKHNAPDDDKYFMEWDANGNGQLYVVCGEAEWAAP